MQAMNPEICDKMPDDYSTMTLTDTRNNQDYRVRKMPDDKCWMIDNLKLELSTGMQLTSDTSNVPAGSPITVTLGGSGTYTGNFITSGSMGYDYWAQANPSDDSTLTTTISCAQRQMVDPDSTTGCGYLYNWYTATASSGTQATSSGYVTSSICPAGWHLPRGADGTTAQNEFAVLNSAMYNGSLAGDGGTSNTQYVQNWWHTGLFAGPRSGYYYSGFGAQGFDGSFWSSSAYFSTDAWALYFNYSDVFPGMYNLGSKRYGFAVRCVV
jgi:uncharacterized protein (TIGR02145 family)